MPETTKWDHKPLSDLIKKGRIDKYELAKAIDIKQTTLEAYLHNGNAPKLVDMIAIADALNVPMDYLCGRCTEEEARRILADYPKNFSEMYKNKREAYLAAGLHWPYNLVNDIVKGRNSTKTINCILTSGHIDAIDYMVRHLPDKLEEIIRLYYHDYKTVDEIVEITGEEKHLINMRLIEAISELRKPYNLDVIRIGVDVAERAKKAVRTAVELKKRIKAIEDMIADAENVGLITLKQEILSVKHMPSDIIQTVNPLSTNLKDLPLSKRAYNALRILGCKTLEDALNATRKRKLNGARNIGSKTREEILEMIQDTTGEDLNEVYE